MKISLIKFQTQLKKMLEKKIEFFYSNKIMFKIYYKNVSRAI